MDREIFDIFRRIAYQKAGIALADGKQALVAGRVAKRLRVLGLRTEGEYARLLSDDSNDAEVVHFLDAISTNFTSFNRESDHFEELRHAVEDRLAEGQTRFRFWSAACSSGEEIYSMAMTLSEVFGGRSVDWRILGTDISTQVLDTAKAALYRSAQLGPVSEALKRKYFTQEKVDGEVLFRVVPALRERVKFNRLNLSSPPFPMAGPFDVVFCRNVMIYFDTVVRQRLVAEIDRLLAPRGFLLVSHTETLTGCKSGLRMLRPSVYQKPA